MARLQRLRMLIVTVFIAASCAGGNVRHSSIEYRLAIIEGDPIGVASSECHVDDADAITYHYPSGRTVAVDVAKQAVLTIPLNKSVSVRVLDYRAAKSPEMQAVVANVIPGSSD